MPLTVSARQNLASELPVARWMLILRPAVVTATMGVAMLILPREAINKTPIAAVVLGTYLLTFFYWLSQKISGFPRSILAVQIAFDILTITIIIHYTGGSDSSFVGFYFLSIMCAALFFRRLITFLYTLMAISAYLSYLAYFGHLFAPWYLGTAARQGLYLQALLYGLLMFAVGLLSSYYSERLYHKDTALSSALRMLKEARLDTSDILQSMNNGLIAFDIFGRVMYFNTAALNILQLDRSVAGESFHSLLTKRAEELIIIIRRELEEKSSGSDEEIEILDRDGVPFPIGLTIVPLYDTDGGRRGLIVNFKNLTEKQKLIEMLRQSDRMAAIGELSAAIAHEIRNPLASLCNAVELLSEEVQSQTGQISRLLGVIEKETARLHRITTEFLKFARLKNPDIRPVDLRKCIDDVLLLIANDPRKTGEVRVLNRISGNPVVYFDPDHLVQLMINIIINSLEALEGSGVIEIGLEKNDHTTGKYIRLVITDNGPGFPEEAIPSVFEPFFSTKSEGTGLGLALVRKMAVSNHGRVFAKNRSAGGAEIALDIPLHGVEDVQENSRGR